MGTRMSGIWARRSSTYSVAAMISRQVRNPDPDPAEGLDAESRTRFSRKIQQINAIF